MLLEGSHFLLSINKPLMWILIASLKTIPVIFVIALVRHFGSHLLSAATKHRLWFCVLISLSIPLGWDLPVTVPWQKVHETVELSFDASPQQLLNKTESSKPVSRTYASTNKDQLNATKVFQYWPSVITGLWLLGFFVGLFITLKRNAYFTRVRIEAQEPQLELKELFEQCKAQLQLGQNVELLMSSAINSPMTHGCLKPVVLAPINLEEQLATNDIRNIFLHELAHIKRKDILINWIACIVCLVHWFNPLAWWANKWMRRDMEFACDALVLDRLSHAERLCYGVTLIKVSEWSSSPAGAIAVAGILENHTELKERLTMIKTFSLPTLRAHILYGLLLITTAIAAVAQPELPENQTPTTSDAVANDVRELIERKNKLGERSFKATIKHANFNEVTEALSAIIKEQPKHKSNGDSIVPVTLVTDIENNRIELRGDYELVNVLVFKIHELEMGAKQKEKGLPATKSNILVESIVVVAKEGVDHLFDLQWAFETTEDNRLLSRAVIGEPIARHQLIEKMVLENSTDVLSMSNMALGENRGGRLSITPQGPKIFQKNPISMNSADGRLYELPKNGLKPINPPKDKSGSSQRKINLKFKTTTLGDGNIVLDIDQEILEAPEGQRAEGQSDDSLKVTSKLVAANVQAKDQWVVLHVEPDASASSEAGSHVSSVKTGVFLFVKLTKMN